MGLGRLVEYQQNLIRIELGASVRYRLDVIVLYSICCTSESPDVKSTAKFLLWQMLPLTDLTVGIV